MRCSPKIFQIKSAKWIFCKWSQFNFQFLLHIRIQDLGDLYANLIKSRYTLGQILIICFKLSSKKLYLLKKSLCEQWFTILAQNQFQNISQTALFWLTNKRCFKLIIMQWSQHYWKHRKQFLWKSADTALIFTAGFEFLLGQTNIQYCRKRAPKIENLVGFWAEM